MAAVVGDDAHPWVRASLEEKDGTMQRRVSCSAPQPPPLLRTQPHRESYMYCGMVRTGRTVGRRTVQNRWPIRSFSLGLWVVT